MKRYVLLGAGVAGKRAAVKIREKDPKAGIVVLDEQTDSFYYKPMLGELVAGRVREERIATRDRDTFSRLGARILTGVRAMGLDLAGQAVLLENEERIPFDSLLISTGTRRLLPDGVGTEVPGVFSLDHLADAKQIVARTGAARKAVVFGMSLQALSAVWGLRRKGLACTLMLPEDRLWPGVLDPVASEIVEDRLRQDGIALAKRSDVKGFVVKEGRLTGVTTSGGEELPADLFIVAARRVPAAEFLSGSGLAGASGVPVDEKLRTKQANIFAAGDVALPPAASFMDLPFPHTGWLNAWEQGSVAGINMSGGEAVYSGYPALRTRAMDLDLVCLGLSDADPGTVREETGDYPFEELPYIYKKIVYRDRKVSGALFLGDASEAGRVGQWIRRGVDAEQCDRTVLDQMFQARITAIQSIGALCPVCKYQIELEDTCRDGDVVTCPACGVEFRLERMPNGAFRAGFAAPL